MKKKVLILFGTRPEAIKMAPLCTAFQQHTDFFETKVCVTAQHREMLDQVLNFFDLTPDYDLNLMKPGQNLYGLTGDIIAGLKDVLESFKPDLVFVHGDTTTTMAGALASFYSGALVGHVEAGLRTFNKRAPFPEEMNRSITGRLTDFHFAPTSKAQENLLSEGIGEDSIVVTGNTVIDALVLGQEKLKVHPPENLAQLEELVDPNQKMVLVTGHRRENFGDGFLNICKALKELAQENPEVNIIYPVHLNPNVQKPVNEILGDQKNIQLIDPQPYPSFLWLMERSYLIITDSGGIQEEAPSLGKPVLVMRETTERPEAVDAGTVILVGTDPEKIKREAQDLISNPERYNQMSHLHNPYGDGKACEYIIDYVKKNLK